MEGSFAFTTLNVSSFRGPRMFFVELDAFPRVLYLGRFATLAVSGAVDALGASSLPVPTLIVIAGALTTVAIPSEPLLLPP